MASEKEQVDQSALINLDSLEVRKSRGGAQAGFEESGLIDLSGFTGGGPAETRATAGVPSGGPIVAGFVAAPKQSNNTLWIVLGVIILAILVVVAVFVGMILAQGDQQPLPPIANAPAVAPAPAPAANPPPAPAAAPAAAAPAGEAQPDAGSATAAAPDAGSAPVAANDKPSPPKPARTPTRRATPRPSAPAPRPSPAAASPSPEDEPPPAEAPKPTPPKPAPPKPPKEETSEVDDLLGSLNGDKPAKPAGGGSDPVAAPVDPMLPQALTKRQIITVVRRNAGGVRKCKAQPPGASGTVTVKMQIAPNGSVSSAEIAGGPVKGTAQGNCVERTVKVFRFPQFGGDPMQINMPFSM